MRLLTLLVSILLPVCNLAFLLTKNAFRLRSYSPEETSRTGNDLVHHRNTFLKQSYYSGYGGKYGRSRGGPRGRGGGRGSGRGRPPQNHNQPLRFTKTIKIDPDVRTSVDEMEFSDNTLRVLKEKGFDTLTPVQSQSFDSVYSGIDVVARSRTGTGKTFAFGLPLIEKIVAAGDNRLSRDELPLVLVLEPTR